jgi:hypothetical protein
VWNLLQLAKIKNPVAFDHAPGRCFKPSLVAGRNQITEANVLFLRSEKGAGEKNAFQRICEQAADYELSARAQLPPWRHPSGVLAKNRPWI